MEEIDVVVVVVDIGLIDAGGAGKLPERTQTNMRDRCFDEPIMHGFLNLVLAVATVVLVAVDELCAVVLVPPRVGVCHTSRTFNLWIR